MLIHLLRTLQGYLKIRITGYSPERFLNLCKHKKIQIWGLESHGNAYEMYMKVSGFRKLKPIIRKTQTKVTIVKRYGLPFFFQRYRKRKLFFAGTFAAISLIYFLSFFIWDIDIIGNFSITDDVLFDFLDSENIYHGMLKKNVNCEQMARNIRKEFNDIVWVSVSLDGTRIEIEVKENTDTFHVSEQEDTPTDIVATKDGVIVSIITRNGVPQVAVGDEVKAGDILVSGTIDVMNDSQEVVSQHFVSSDADVIAETTVQYEEQLNTVYEEKEYIGKSGKFIYLKFGERFFKLGFSQIKEGDCEEYLEENQLELKENFHLPICFGMIQNKAYKMTKQEYSEEEREQILTEHFTRYCRELEMQDAVILENELYISHNAKNSTAVAEIKLQEAIGENRKIIDLSSEPMLE